MVVLDACAIIELYQPHSSLSKKIEKTIGEGAHVLSISFAEIALKEKRGLLSIEPGSQEIYEQWHESEEIQIVSLGVQEWFDAIHLDWSHRDPADRLVVAYAKRHRLPIVTSDKKIKRFYKNVIW